jgi:Transglutaminase-like superfamily/Coenzyme PQQ synthesis protein D (PqqD)
MQPFPKPLECSLTTGSDSQDGGVLLDLERDRLIKLNSVSVAMWNLLKQGCSEAEIVTRICRQYGVDRKRVTTDLRTFLAKLSELQLIPGNQFIKHQESSGPTVQDKTVYPWYGKSACDEPNPTLTLRIVSFLGLVLFDLILGLASLKTLCHCVHTLPRQQRRSSDPLIVGRVCAAVRAACLWYPKRTLCLQRSAVTTCLLRRYGIAAQMVIGVRPMPLLAHAWVEIGGSVVNDWPAVRTFYQRVTAQ